MKDCLDIEQFQGYCICNVIKYISRHTNKGGLEDLKKAEYYLDEIIQDYVPKFKSMDDVLKFTNQLKFFEAHVIINMFINIKEARKTLRWGIENYEHFSKF
jgi:hypothetical protein